MKFFFTIILIMSMLVQRALALDTLRHCGPGTPLEIFSDFLPFCPTGLFSLSLDGVPVALADTIYPGAQGTALYSCINSIPFDSTFYLTVTGIPDICAMTSDTNNRLTIYIDSSSLANHNSLSLRRQATIQSWQTVTTFRPIDPLVIMDSSVITSSQSYNYRIESNDLTCPGRELTSLHLQANGNNLIWNNGGGIGLRGYYIHKRSGSNFILIDSTANLTYTDNNFQSGDEYFVEAFKDGGCQSNSWARTDPSPISIRSNKFKFNQQSSDTCFITIYDTLEVTVYDTSTLIIPIILQAGWNMIAYLRNSPMDAATAMTSISTNVLLMKNNSGQTYIPSIGVNTLDKMLPGQGYKVKTSVADTLYYPGN